MCPECCNLVLIESRVAKSGRHVSKSLLQLCLLIILSLDMASRPLALCQDLFGLMTPLLGT